MNWQNPNVKPPQKFAPGEERNESPRDSFEPNSTSPEPVLVASDERILLDREPFRKMPLGSPRRRKATAII